MSTKIIRLELSEKLWVNPTLHQPNKKKRDSLVFLFWVEVTFECYGGAMVFRVFSFIFCVETTVRENNCMRTTSVVVMVTFFEGAIRKVLDHSYVQSSFSIITRHLDHGITAQKLKFSIKDFFSKCDQIRRKSLM